MAVGGAHMAARSRDAAAAQHELAAQELAIIFADRAGRGAEAGIGTIGAAGPFPPAAEPLPPIGVHWRRGREVDRAGRVDLLDDTRIRTPTGMERGCPYDKMQ